MQGEPNEFSHDLDVVVREDPRRTTGEYMQLTITQRTLVGAGLHQDQHGRLWRVHQAISLAEIIPAAQLSSQSWAGKARAFLEARTCKAPSTLSNNAVFFIQLRRQGKNLAQRAKMQDGQDEFSDELNVVVRAEAPITLEGSEERVQRS